jgi:hypothetical protein
MTDVGWVEGWQCRSPTRVLPTPKPNIHSSEGFIITQLHSRMLGFGVAHSLSGIDLATPQPNLRLSSVTPTSYVTAYAPKGYPFFTEQSYV